MTEEKDRDSARRRRALGVGRHCHAARPACRNGYRADGEATRRYADDRSTATTSATIAIDQVRASWLPTVKVNSRACPETTDVGSPVGFGEGQRCVRRGLADEGFGPLMASERQHEAQRDDQHPPRATRTATIGATFGVDRARGTRFTASGILLGGRTVHGTQGESALDPVSVAARPSPLSHAMLLSGAPGSEQTRLVALRRAESMSPERIGTYNALGNPREHDRTYQCGVGRPRAESAESNTAMPSQGGRPERRTRRLTPAERHCWNCLELP